MPSMLTTMLAGDTHVGRCPGDEGEGRNRGGSVLSITLRSYEILKQNLPLQKHARSSVHPTVLWLSKRAADVSQ